MNWLVVIGLVLGLLLGIITIDNGKNEWYNKLFGQNDSLSKKRRTSIVISILILIAVILPVIIEPNIIGSTVTAILVVLFVTYGESTKIFQQGTPVFARIISVLTCLTLCVLLLRSDFSTFPGVKPSAEIIQIKQLEQTIDSLNYEVKSYLLTADSLENRIETYQMKIDSIKQIKYNNAKQWQDAINYLNNFVNE